MDITVHGTFPDREEPAIAIGLSISAHDRGGGRLVATVTGPGDNLLGLPQDR